MDKNFFNNRRSIRSYTSQEVTDEMLENIVQQALRTPTCGNMQLYSVVATRAPEMKKKLAACHFNQPMVEGCSVMLTICADYKRFSRWCELNNADPGFDNFLSFVTAATDALLLTQQITTIAEMQGLGTCFLGTVTFNAPEISEILHLPDLVIPIACLTIGYPADNGVETERLPLKAVLHMETYRDDSDEEIIEQFKAKDDYPANQKFIQENAKENLAQVYTDVRYPRAMNEEFSQKFLNLLKLKRFLK